MKAWRDWIGVKSWLQMRSNAYRLLLWAARFLVGGAAMADVLLLLAMGRLVLSNTFEILTGTHNGELRSYLYFLVALVGLPFVIWRTKVAQDQVRVSEQGLFTDRFTKAVEQLGAEKVIRTDDGEVTAPNLELRLGGMFALERLAKDSLHDHITIMEVLCAYIRNNAPVKNLEMSPHKDLHHNLCDDSAYHKNLSKLINEEDR